MKRIFWFFSGVGFLLLFSGCGEEGSLLKHEDSDTVVGVEKGDPEMEAAYAEARATLKEFVAELENRDSDSRYLLKMKLTEGEESEHVWLEPVRWNDPGLEGILAVEPVVSTEFKMGDALKPLPDEISDWLIISADGSSRGGFTSAVIESRR